jgi:SAM-dependent methyltransferase
MSSNASYGEKSYWNTRYGGPQLETYEWYMPWAQLKDYILKPVHGTHTTAPFVPSTPAPRKAPPATADTTSPDQPPTEGESKAASASSTAAAESSSSSAVAAAASSAAVCSGCRSLRYLIVGCGNSELSAHMWLDGFRHLVSVDYSEIVIQKMKLLYESENMKELADTFKVADCREMNDTPDGTYDVIIDKGTLDALLCGSESNKHQAALLLEIHRVLKRGGVFILITYGQTTSRLSYLERPKFSWDVSHVPLGPTRFLYACVKRGGSVKSHE